MKRNLTLALARQAFRYNPASGLLKWRINKGRARIGDVAGCPDNKGYINVMFDGRNIKAHRIIWALKTGRWPRRQIDHRDGVKGNNRWRNLREASNQQNHRNRGKNKNNTSGFKGVVYKGDTPRRRPWAAHIMIDGKNVHLGHYDTKIKAAAAVVAGSQKYFGEFAHAQ
jgi:hypothetical protein